MEDLTAGGFEEQAKRQAPTLEISGPLPFGFPAFFLFVCLFVFLFFFAHKGNKTLKD